MVDGLCHQAANRILRSSALKVEKARGYKLSFSIYGHYGRRKWRWTDCCIACKR